LARGGRGLPRVESCMGVSKTVGVELAVEGLWLEVITSCPALLPVVTMELR
jgi:hypothetical protein